MPNRSRVQRLTNARNSWGTNGRIPSSLPAFAFRWRPQSDSDLTRAANLEINGKTFRLVFSRPLDRVDHEDGQRAFGGFQFEAKLIFDRCGKRGSRGI